jgi:lipopolysaccharide export system permease protein
MVVWFSCGQPLTAWIRPVLVFALPIVIAIAVLSGFLSPWANSQADDYKQRLAARSDVSQVSPGAFREAKGGRRVFFVESVADDATHVGNVFVAAMQDGKLGVVMSDTGYQEMAPNGDKFVVLESGRRYEVEPGTAQFKIMEFERYKVRVQDGEAKPAQRSPSRLTIDELLIDTSKPARGELLRRIGFPVSAIILSLLAIPLSYVNPRAGRSANMLIAILVYAIYINMLSVSEAFVTQGKLSFWVGIWAAHAVMLLPLLFLFYRRIVVRMPWQRRGN